MKVKEFLSDPRRKVIAATIATSAILLILVVMLIVNIASLGNKGKTSTTDVAVSNPVEVIDDTLAAAEDKNVEPVDNSDDAGLVIIPSEPIATTTEDLPKTGPESILPLALLAATATAFLLSRKQKLAYNC